MQQDAVSIILSENLDTVTSYPKISLLIDVCKKFWLNGKELEPDQTAVELGSTMFARAYITKYLE